jgi:hypothetical protein
LKDSGADDPSKPEFQMFETCIEHREKKVNIRKHV